jgi:hypothetical protein
VTRHPVARLRGALVLTTAGCAFAVAAEHPTGTPSLLPPQLAASFDPGDTRPYRVVELVLAITNPNPSDPVTGVRLSDQLPTCLRPLFRNGEGIEVSPESCRASLGRIDVAGTHYPYLVSVGGSAGGATVSAGTTCELRVPLATYSATTPCTTTTSALESDQGEAPAVSASVSAPTIAPSVWVSTNSSLMGFVGNWQSVSLPPDGRDILFGPSASYRYVLNNLSPNQNFGALLFSDMDYELHGTAFNLKGNVVATTVGTVIAAPLRAMQPIAIQSNFNGDVLGLKDLDLNGHDVYFGVPGRTFVSGAISGIGNVHVPVGTLVVQATPTFDGAWLVSGGSLELQSESTQALFVGGDGVVENLSGFGATTVRAGGAIGRPSSGTASVSSLSVEGGELRIGVGSGGAHGAVHAAGTVQLSGGTLALRYDPFVPLADVVLADIVTSDTGLTGCFDSTTVDRPALAAFAVCDATSVSALVVVNAILVDGFE